MATTPKFRPKILFACLGIGILLLAAGIVYKSHHKPAMYDITASQSTKGEPVQSSGTGSSSQTSSSTSKGSTSSSNEPGDQKSSTGGDTSATLLTPSGQLISNHTPASTSSTETSVCTTTPGATCVISFTKDGVTKSLPPQTTDRGGSSYWNNWSINDAQLGLSAGSWQVTATATLNGQSKTFTYGLDLVVPQ